MLKKGLFAIALLGLLAVSAQALTTTYNVSLTNTGGNGWVKIDPNTDSGFNTGFSLGTWYKQWPGTVTVTTEYTAIDLCCIPVYLEVGMYAEIYQCGNQKITLKQVPCSQITYAGGHGNDYPCYQGCTNFGVRGNFPMLLKYKKDNNGSGVDPNAASILPANQWAVRFVPPQCGFAGVQFVGCPGANSNMIAGNVIPVTLSGQTGAGATVPAGLPDPSKAGSYHVGAICVQAWKANLMYNLFSNPGLSSGNTLMKIGQVCITVQPQ